MAAVLDDIASQRRARYVSTMHAQWHFLKPYFARVATRCSLNDPDCDDTHAVRIGREVHDWWIDVQLENYALDARPIWAMVTRIEQYRQVGESLRIMAMLARIDYRSWLGELIRGTQYQVPSFMKLRVCEQLPRQFAITFRSDLPPARYQWKLLRHALSPEGDRQEFERDMETIVQMATTRNAPIDWCAKLLDPIPIKLVIAPRKPATLGDQVRILQGITTTVNKLYEIETAWRAARVGSESRAGPVFHVHSVDLDLRAFEFHPDLLSAIQQLVETDIRITSLVLPSVMPAEMDEANVRLHWALFLSTALGHRSLPRTRDTLAKLDRLVVPTAYMTELLMVPLLSAVTSTPVLKWIRIESSLVPYPSERTPDARSDYAIESRLWKWLVYALFSDATSNSIKTLELDGFENLLGHTLLDSAKEITCRRDPLAHLWRSVTPASLRGFRTVQHVVPAPRPRVAIARNASIAVRVTSRETTTVTSAFPFSALVIHDDPREKHVDVLVPGLGFCVVLRTQLQMAPAIAGLPRVRALGPLKCLVVGNKRTPWFTPTRAFVLQLLQLVGPTLTALALEAQLLNEDCLRAALRLCPNLESLRLRGVMLRSMAVITDLYEQPTCRLSSLDVRDVQAKPTQSFDQFLVQLAQRASADPLVKTLRRLRIGRGPSSPCRDVTDTRMEAMLQTNDRLIHFHLYEPVRLRDVEGARLRLVPALEPLPRSHWMSNRFGGEMVADVPLPRATRVALLSVLRDNTMLPPEIVQLILGFGTATWRRVHFTVDAESPASRT